MQYWIVLTKVDASLDGLHIYLELASVALLGFGWRCGFSSHNMMKYRYTKILSKRSEANCLNLLRHDTSKNMSGSRPNSKPLVVKNQFYPKTLETLNHQRDPQEWSRSLKRLSSSDMFDNLTKIEETNEKIERKENFSSSRIIWQEIYFADNFGASSGKMSDKEDQKRRTLEKGAEPSIFFQKARVLENHLIKINKPNGNIKASP